MNGEASLATDSHSIQSELNARLINRQEAAVPAVGIASKSWVEENGPFVDRSAINVSDVNFSQNASSVGGDGASSDLQLFNFQELPFGFFSLQPAFFGQVGQVVGGDMFSLHVASNVSQSQGQQDQSVYPHRLSFGTPTLPPDRKSVHQVAGNGQWTMVDDGLSNPNNEPCTIHHSPVPDGPTWQQVNSHA
jgi:hypothetical protein